MQVELIDDVLLFRSDDLYCHGVLHVKQQGLDTYLIESKTYIFLLSIMYTLIFIINTCIVYFYGRYYFYELVTVYCSHYWLIIAILQKFSSGGRCTWLL